MAKVVYSKRALSDLERLFAWLAQNDPSAALLSSTAISSGVNALEHHPLVGRLRPDGLRELVISYGRTGYIALYRFLPTKKEVRVLALRHQRELDYPAN